MKVILLGLAVVASETSWDYSENGKNWPEIEGYEDCGFSN
jgi:hypothetical protein